MKGIKHKNDFVLGILMGLVSLFLLFGKVLEKEVTNAQGGFFARPDVWLRLMGGILLVCAVAIIIRSFTGGAVTDPEKDGKFHFYLDEGVVCTVIMLILYAIGLPQVGFFISTFLGTMFLVVLYSVRERGYTFKTTPKDQWGKILVRAVIVSVVFLVLFYIVFGKLLSIQLPEGELLYGFLH